MKQLELPNLASTECERDHSKTPERDHVGSGIRGPTSVGKPTSRGAPGECAR